MNDISTTNDNGRTGRALLAVGGLATFIGGGMHPEAPDGLSLGDNLAFMMQDEGKWVTGHAITAVGAALILAGFVTLKRRGGWPVVASLLPVCIVGAALFLAEMSTHTAAVVDRDGLVDGDWGPVLTTHLAFAVVAYPVFGAVTALLGWRLVRTWSLPLRPFAALGIVGGVAHAIAGLGTIALTNPDFATFFPIGGIATAIFYVAAGVTGLRRAPAPVAPAVAA